jgi:adenylate cyclase
MTDLVRYLAGDGTLVRDQAGRWTVGRALATVGDAMPESVRAMIERKIAQLGDDDRALLTAASVQGYEFDCVVVARVLSRDAVDLEERLEALARVQRFVAFVAERELPDGTLTSRYRFVHVLYQNALYSHLRATRRVALSAAVADTLAHYHERRVAEVATELAALYEAARDNARAARHCLVATERAARCAAALEAIGLATRGLALLAGTPTTRDRLEVELGFLIALGNAFIAVRGYACDEVRETYTRAIAVCEELGDAQDRAAVLYGFTAFHLVGGRHARALEHATEMLAYTERRQHPASIVAHRMVGWALLAMGRTDEAVAHLERGRTMYAPSTHAALAYSFGQEPGLAVAVILAIALQRSGRAAEAKRVCTETLAMARTTTHANSRCYVLHFASLYAQLSGDRDLTRSLSEEALHIAEEQGLRLWMGWCGVMHGWALADGGELDAGVAEMSRGVDAARDLGHELCHSYYLALLVDVLLRAGRVSEAVQRLEEAERLVSVNDERFWAGGIAQLRVRLVSADPAAR